MALKTTKNKPKILVLPPIVVGRMDVGRMVREIKALQDFLDQAAVRKPGTQAKLPHTSRLVDEFIQVNSLNLLHEKDRQTAVRFLALARDRSPVIHMSFSADPSPLFTLKLVTWLRKELHPQLLLQVGLQPNIGAGCYLRTTNKYFDFSLRQMLAQKQDSLRKILENKQNPEPVVAAQSPPVKVVA